MSKNQKIIIAILVYLIFGIVGYTVSSVLIDKKERRNEGGQANRAMAATGAMSTKIPSVSPSTAAPSTPVSPNTSLDIGTPDNYDNYDNYDNNDYDIADRGHNEVILDNELRPGFTASSESTVNSSSSAIAITNISTPNYNDNNKTYSFLVSADGLVGEFVLINEAGEYIMSNSNGNFDSVPPTATGVYYVYAKDPFGAKTKECEVTGCIFKVQKVSASELNRILNSGDSNEAIKANFRNRIAPGCRFIFLGRDDSACISVLFCSAFS